MSLYRITEEKLESDQRTTLAEECLMSARICSVYCGGRFRREAMTKTCGFAKHHFST